MEKKNIHKDHRQRVRERYLREGIGSMADHNIVELLLFYGIPYKDTNGIAHALIESFGDINGVLDAPLEDLKKIDGIGESTAILIKLTKDIALRYSENSAFIKDSSGHGQSILDYAAAKLSAQTKEIVFALSVDANGRVRRCTKVCDGSPDTAEIDSRALIEAALRFDSKFLVLAHNHPNGFAVPSLRDVSSTEQARLLLASVGIKLVDHIIVSPDDAFSMARSNKYKGLFG